LVDSLADVCAMTPEERYRAGQVAAARIHSRFSVDACQRAFGRLYAEAEKTL
jgi:hypothetical protein